MNQDNNQKNHENEIYTSWEERSFFKADPVSDKKPYSLLMPPPNLTGELHLGHAMQHSILDAIARFKRMQGYDVLLLPGVDHAGIQFEGTLNKLLAKEGLSKYKMGREEWLKRAWQFKDAMYESFHKTWTVFGLSADWNREVFTLEPKVQKAVLQEFKTFWEQDLLYKGAYIVQWCPKCGTAIEDVEMEYEERKEKLYFVKYLLEPLSQQDATPEYITVATARPETIFADVAIAVYPNHPQYKKYIGRTAYNPLGSKDNALMLQIIEDERVEKDFGTGALKITPGHDHLDYEIGKDNNLPIKHAVDKTGKMTDLAGDLAGLKIEEARKKAEEKLQELGAIEKIEEYVHSVPVCERCKTVVEPLISEEWFVKMKPLAEKGLKNMDKINFLPANYKEILSEWMEKIHDWSISRNLWWGHRIPVWYCQNCNPNRQVGKDKDMVISFDKPEQTCKTCGKSEWIQDEQVLDTWFSSGLWPFAVLSNKTVQGKPSATFEFEDNMGKYFPWDFAVTAPEIRYLWIARMIMLSLYFTDDIPFKNMFFHGMLRDLQGRKFSKSLGNGIDPNDLREQWGTDAVRMALYSYSVPGRDNRTSRQVMDERCKNFRNFGTKLRNITRFIIDLKPESTVNRHSGEQSESGIRSWTSPSTLSYSTVSSDRIGSEPKSQDDKNLHPDDKEILEKMNNTIKTVTKNIESFNLHLATEDLYNYVWHEFADIYIEKSKTRREETQPVLEYVLMEVIKMLYPFMPFTAEELYQKLPGHKESIMLESWPVTSK